MTRSMRIEREPLTSTQSPARSASRSAAAICVWLVAMCARPGSMPAASAASRTSGANLPSAKSAVDAKLAGERADAAVSGLRVRAELAHVAEHRERAARAAQPREARERDLHRLRVRVVGVVDQQRAARELHLLHAALRRRVLREARGDLERGSRPRRGSRTRGDGVRHGRLAEPRLRASAARLAARPASNAKPSPSSAHVLGAHGAIGAAAEEHDARTAALRLRAREHVVARQHRGSVRANRRDEVALLLGDRLARAQELDVRGADRRDHADRRVRDRCERRDLAAVVHAELDHERPVFRAAAQQRERKAELVVEVALRREARPELAQDRGAHLLGRGLAVAAGDRDDGAGEARAVTGGERAERARRVGRDEHGNARARRHGVRALDEEAGGARGERVREEAVGIVDLAANRDEEGAARQRARIDRRTRERGARIAARERRAGPLRDVAHAEGQAHRGRLTSARCASSRSSNGNRSRPRI